MDFPGIAELLTTNPLVGAIGVILFLAWVNGYVGRSGAANLSNVLAFAGTQSAELNKRSEQAVAAEREKGALLAENMSLKAEKDSLRDRVETLELEVSKLARDAGQVDFLDSRLRDIQAELKTLQNKHDALQEELDNEKRKNTELQAKLDLVQAELDTLRGQTALEEAAPVHRKLTEYGDEIL